MLFPATFISASEKIGVGLKKQAVHESKADLAVYIKQDHDGPILLT